MYQRYYLIGGNDPDVILREHIFWSLLKLNPDIIINKIKCIYKS